MRCVRGRGALLGEALGRRAPGLWWGRRLCGVWVDDDDLARKSDWVESAAGVARADAAHHWHSAEGASPEPGDTVLRRHVFRTSMNI